MHDRIKISIHAPRAGCDSTRRGFPAFAQISIHAPRAGCDPTRVRPPIRWAISIHVPRAGCDYASGDRSLTVKQTFQSTYPVRGATTIFTLPLVRSRRFQSTYPVRGATGFPAHAKTTSGISIHVPRAGCDGKFDDFNPLNLHKRYKRVLDRPKSTSEQGKNKAKLAYIHVFTVFWGGCEGAGTVCALLLRTQYC